MNFKAAIFDMDGTLVDSLMLLDIMWIKLGEKFLGDRNFHPTPEDDKAIRTMPLTNIAHLLHLNYGMGESVEEVLEFLNIVMDDFYGNDVKLKSGVKEFLEYCREKGIRMCIASATAPELIKIALKNCSVYHYFEKIFSCAVSGKGKEFPDVFISALEYLKFSVEDICVFEDSLVAIKTANKIGMKTVGIYDKYNFGQEQIKEIADIYVGKDENLTKLVLD